MVTNLKKTLAKREQVMNTKISTAVATVLLGSAGMAAAQQATTSATTELSRITVADTVDAGYVATSASSATRTDTPLLETPMAIQIIPSAILEDQQVLTIQDAVKNVSGVQSTQQFYDQFLIRGFSSGYGTTFRDGLQLRGVYGGVDMAFIERIEIAKGPTSMLYGRIEPGGLINQVTKSPKAVAAFSLQQQAGSWGQLRTVADATGKVVEDGTLLYRLIGVYDKGDSFVDNVHHSNWAAAGTLGWHPTSRFDATLQLEHYDSKMAAPSNSAGQVPTIGNRPANLPRHFSTLDPVIWSNFPYTVKRTLFGLDWTFAFNDNWKITNRAHYVDSDENTSQLFVSSFNGVDTFNSRTFSYQPGWVRKTFSGNLDLAGSFATGAVTHTVLVGVDYYSATDDTPGTTGAVAGFPTLNIFAPVYNASLSQLQSLAAAAANNILYRDSVDDTGIYIQDQMSIGEQWSVLFGVRHDEANSGNSLTYGSRSSSCFPNCTGYPFVDLPTTKADSPHLGVVFMPSATTSVYASYSESFGNQYSPRNFFSGVSAPPESGKQYELGLKASLVGGKVTGSVTVFDLYKSNVIGVDTVHPGFLTATGEVRSRGVEIDAVGELTENISLIGNYSYDEALITKDAPAPFGNPGKKYAGVPLSSASLWARYDFAPGAGDGFSAGGGVQWVGQRQGNNSNTYQLPGYARFDAMLGYRTSMFGPRIAAQININNVFDRTYFDATGSYYGAPRSVMGSVRLDF